MKNSLRTLSLILLTASLISACAQSPSPQPQAALPVDKSMPTQPPSSAKSSEPGATSGPGLVAVQASTAVPGVISAPLGSTRAPVSPTPAKPSGTGQKVLTRDDRGQTIELTVGETVLLDLGAGYTWQITNSDPAVLSRLAGAQEMYQALKPGTVTLSAAGDPLCRQSNPPCGMPSVIFEFTVIVK